MNMGIIGAGGYWAANLIRNLKAHPGVSDLLLCEIDARKKERLGEREKGRLTIYSDFQDKDFLANTDAIIVSTPIETHFEIAKYLLKQKKHLLVQKPLAGTEKKCLELWNLAKKNDVVLMPAHTYLYNESIKNIFERIAEIGELRYFKSVRINLGLFNRNSDVIYDLLPHDLSIFLHLFPRCQITSVIATGKGTVSKNIIDTANITLCSDQNFMCNIDVSWISAIKKRELLIAGSKKTIFYDDCQNQNPVSYIDSGVDFEDSQRFAYRRGTVECPQIASVEAIYNEITAFLSLIKSNTNKYHWMQYAVNVAKIIEAAEESIASRSEIPVNLEKSNQ